LLVTAADCAGLQPLAREGIKTLDRNLRTALQALRYALWDSDLERLVPFRFAAAGSRYVRRIDQHSGD